MSARCTAGDGGKPPDSGCFAFVVALLLSIGVALNLLVFVVVPGVACDPPEIKTEACAEFRRSWVGKQWNRTMDLYRKPAGKLKGEAK